MGAVSSDILLVVYVLAFMGFGVKAAMKAGIEAACTIPGVLEIDAGNFGGNLGAYQINLQDLF